ncbi:Uncharacterised protein [Vibrio cholerae]|nr:Uncharacterised protein [Vibrio cholerae]
MGKRDQMNPSTMVEGGNKIISANTAGKWLSTNGANHSPARKPIITVGRASINSMVGFTTRRIEGVIK